MALEEAAAFIQERDGSGAAQSWLRAMRASVEKLETLPKAFGVWTKRDASPVFAKLVKSYRVFYIVDDETATVHVIDVVHTARETKLAEYRGISVSVSALKSASRKIDVGGCGRSKKWQ